MIDVDTFILFNSIKVTLLNYFDRLPLDYNLNVVSLQPIRNVLIVNYANTH